MPPRTPAARIASTLLAVIPLLLGCKGSDDGGPGGTSGLSSGSGATATGSSGSSGGSNAPGTTPDPSTPTDASKATPGEGCESGTTQCGDSAFCCPEATECLANPYYQYCGAEFCCFGCGGGSACGGGCCSAGTQCTANDGNSPDCYGDFCCVAKAEPECPGDVAAQCPDGTTCLFNKSARACSDDFACYSPYGVIACPGEVACPNGLDFCPGGLHCEGLKEGVCPQQSTSGNYCCKAFAGIGDSCDFVPCEPGTKCVPQNHCLDSDPNATSVCMTETCTSYPIDCGNYCCAADYPVCGTDCVCYTN